MGAASEAHRRGSHPSIVSLGLLLKLLFRPPSASPRFLSRALWAAFCHFRLRLPLSSSCPELFRSHWIASLICFLSLSCPIFPSGEDARPVVLDSSVLRVAMSAMSHVAPALSVPATLLPYAPPSLRRLHPVLQLRQSHKAHSHTVPLCRSIGKQKQAFKG